VLFTPPSIRTGWSAPPTDFRSASSLEKGHGRVEKRRITVSSLLSSYSKWPGLSQVFRLERERTNALGETEQEVAYGLTSLPASVATPRRLLALVREHWGIENGLHHRRDQTFREDWSQLRMGHAPQVLAASTILPWGFLLAKGKPFFLKLNAVLPISLIVNWLVSLDKRRLLTLQQPWPVRCSLLVIAYLHEKMYTRVAYLSLCKRMRDEAIPC
jgi:hypothetical protein